MEFFTVNGKRPIRLSEPTRRFAWESLNYKYGRLTKETPAVEMDGHEGFEQLSFVKKYDACIRKIAEQAPIRICDSELISGAATLGYAIYHQVPATYKGEKFCYSVSHLTVGFDTVLKRGINGIMADIEASLEKHRGTAEEEFLLSCASTVESLRIWHGRYLQALAGSKEYENNYNNLKNVPFNPASSFYEAVQSLWFTFAFIRLCGNWPGIGRIDQLLGEYLERDLEAGRITLDEAREILAHFFIKGCEWISGTDRGSGDAQHYQNIVLAGVDDEGREITNNVTYLVLDIIEELGISDFPTTVRVNENTPQGLLERVAQVICLGGGVVAVYNEALIIDSLVKYGYTLTEARRFANDGCWEVQVPGKTYFTYCPFDSLQILQSVLDEGEYQSFDELFSGYISALTEHVEGIKAMINRRTYVDEHGKYVWHKDSPCTVVSIFEEGCIEKGLSYLEGGPKYNVISPHIGGLPDTVNSLYAIKKLVFDDKIVTFAHLMEILKDNWQGEERLRLFALNKYSYYGNDNDEVDRIAARIIDEFAAVCNKDNKAIMTPAGISTFGRQLEWAGLRRATAFGRNGNEVLAPNFSPTPGTDKSGATAIIRSYCKADLTKTVSGAALDVKLLPAAVNNGNGVEALIGLIKGFISLGGHFMQLDIADKEMLLRAQEHPEDHLNLSVRVSGWNARFVTLNKEWQDMIIAQTGSGF